MNSKRSRRTVASDACDTDFLSLLAHELRNPLAPIRYSTAALRLRCTNEMELKAIATIERQVDLLARLVDDLVDRARLQRGQVTLEKQWVDIGALAQEAVEAMHPFAEERGQHLEANLPTTPVKMLCDPLRLKQVIGNLLNHSSAQTQAGGTIALAVEARPGELLIRISDTGLGIAPEALPHVFGMYAPARAGDARPKRIGMSLAIARGLVELHGGSIRAHSAGLGRGSTFEVRLPLLGTPPRPDVVGKPVTPAASVRILVVDDNFDAASSLTELLTLRGHQALQAHDGESALRIAETFHPSLVLLDICLPDLDGYEVGRRLRALDANVRLIGVTANDSSDDRARAKAAGFEDFLTKPVSIGTLLQALGFERR